MIFLLRATNAHSLFAALVTSMSVGRAHSHALNARPGTSATKVWLFLLKLGWTCQLCFIYLNWEIEEKWRYSGSPRVHGDEEEEGSDDIEKEFAFNIAGISNTMPLGHISIAESSSSLWDMSNSSMENSGPSVPLLTYAEEVIELGNVDLCINASASTGAEIVSAFAVCGNSSRSSCSYCTPQHWRNSAIEPLYASLLVT